MKIEIKNLRKEYGETNALNGINLTLQNGVYGLLGPNGAGKSTLINILTDHIKRTEGEILCDGKDIVKLGKEYRRRVGYMPQTQSCYDTFTAQEFLEYMAVMKGMNRKRKETIEEIQTILYNVNLYDKRNQKIGGFSGGMKRRVLLAQALLGKPEFLILDEPTAGLDPKERISLRNIIAKTSKERIVLAATHIVSDIECIADFIVLVQKGKILRCASPKEFLQSMKTKVGVIHCGEKEILSYQERYCVSSIVQGEDDFILHVTGDELPDNADIGHVETTLEDVYMYYFGEKQEL
ncbi:MAG: ATP-binding cassette domain-containing protein [Clostridiaceae bacterium]|nr:ATP-binding cassette domain-containing protein [Clostridiaceae bacterium]